MVASNENYSSSITAFSNGIHAAALARTIQAVGQKRKKLLSENYRKKARRADCSFVSMDGSVVNIMCDVMGRYIETIALHSVESARSCLRTRANAVDVVKALDKMKRSEVGLSALHSFMMDEGSNLTGLSVPQLPPKYEGADSVPEAKSKAAEYPLHISIQHRGWQVHSQGKNRTRCRAADTW